MTLQQDIVSLALTGRKPADIVRDLGCTRGTVYDYLWKARCAGLPVPRFKSGRSPGSMTITLSPAFRRALQPHADARGINPQELAVLILRAVTDGQLVNAVLDDLDQEDAA